MIRLAAILGLVLLATPARATAPPAPSDGDFYGGDVSMLPRLEELGATYRDDGKPADPVRILMSHGFHCFRVRLFVDPPRQGEVVQDLPYVVSLARRIKAAGAVLLLDIHYSDTWADPGHQAKPAAWRDLAPLELERKVESYTAGVLDTLKAAGALPDVIQIGNEVSSGFLWPDGDINATGGWDRFTALLQAAIRGVRDPLDPDDRVRIMIHYDDGGDAEKTTWFYRNLKQRGVDFDLIGLSYYPWWHGGLADLRLNLQRTAEAFSKGIVVVETAYPWRPDTETAHMDWPQTPDGQKQFLEDVTRAVRETPGGLGQGVLWWDPEAVSAEGIRVWKGGNVALFDDRGEALPAMGVFGDE